MAVEVNSRGVVEVEPPAELDPAALEAAFALGSLGEEREAEEEEVPARACSGPNSRLALAAAGSSASVTPARVELEDSPRAGGLSSEIGWVSASEELRAARDTGAPAL